MDKVSPQQRHANMAAIHGKDTMCSCKLHKLTMDN